MGGQTNEWMVMQHTCKKWWFSNRFCNLYKSITDRRTDRRTNWRTDIPSCRDAIAASVNQNGTSTSIVASTYNVDELTIQRILQRLGVKFTKKKRSPTISSHQDARVCKNCCTLSLFQIHVSLILAGMLFVDATLYIIFMARLAILIMSIFC